MVQLKETGRAFGKAALVMVAMIAIAAPAAAQNVRLYKGTLQIGFGDPTNQTLPPGSNPPADLANNGLPACANANLVAWIESGSTGPASSAACGSRTACRARSPASW